MCMWGTYIGSTAAKDQVIDGFSFYRTPTRGVVPPFRELDHRSGD